MKLVVDWGCCFRWVDLEDHLHVVYRTTCLMKARLTSEGVPRVGIGY